jgi:capsular polysaccharide biosynthesis protein
MEYQSKLYKRTKDAFFLTKNPFFALYVFFNIATLIFQNNTYKLFNYIKYTGLPKMLFSNSKRFVAIKSPIYSNVSKRKYFPDSFDMPQEHTITHNTNVFAYVTPYNALLYKNNRLIAKSAHKHWDERAVKIFAPYFSTFLFDLIQDRANNHFHTVVQRPGKKYLWVHDWFNFYHWYGETVERIWVAKDILKDSIILLPAHYQRWKFVQYTLNNIPDIEVEYLPESDSNTFYLKEVYLVSNKNYCDHNDVAITNQIREHFTAPIKKKFNISGAPKRKIISVRKNVGTRNIANMQQVLEYLQPLGYEAIDFDAYEPEEQIKIMCETHVFLSVHGAGLTNMLFMPAGGHVLEMHKELRKNENQGVHSKIYWKQASALGINYSFLLCKPEDASTHYYEGNILVDMGELKEAISFIEQYG